MNNRFIQALSIRPFLFLWLAEVFSQIAMNMFNFVLIIVAFKLSHSNTAVSGIILSFTLPAVVFGMLAGVFVDRWDKKAVLFSTNALRALLLLILTFWHNSLFGIYSISFLAAVLTQFFIPAETPMIPVLVKKELLLSANALFGMALYGSVLVAYALSGPVLLSSGDTYVFALLSLLFLLAAFFVTLIKEPRSHSAHTGFLSNIHTSEVVGDIKSAFAIMSKTKEIYNSLFLITLSQFIILVLAVLGPGYGIQILGIKVDEFPLLFVTPAAVGMVVGAIVVGNYFQYRNKYKIAAGGAIIAGISIMLLPYGSKVASKGLIDLLNAILPFGGGINILHLMMVLAFVLGMSNAFVFVPSNTLLQEKTHEHYRGKVYGALNALVGLCSLVPVVLVGALADTFGVGRVLTGLGIVIASIGLLNLLFTMGKRK